MNDSTMTQAAVKDYLLLFLKVTAIASFLVLASKYKEADRGFIQYISLMSGLATGLLWVGNAYLSEVFSKKISWIDAPVKRLIVSVAATLVYTFLVWWLITAAWPAPYKGFDLMRPLQGFEWNDFLPTLLITLFITIFMHGRGFLMEWKTAATEAERLKKEQVEARFEALKNQVNPHFLFNSLNVLITLVHKDAEQSEKFIRQLAHVYRYVLESRDKEVVRLEEEIKQLEAYVFLMEIRFGDNFKVHLNIPDQEGYIAPLTLQMLLENVFKHNEVSRNHPMEVAITQADKMIIVKNKKQIRRHFEAHSGVGLENIRSRYQFLSTQPIEVIETAEYFTVKIPLISYESTHH
jgi:hypothetical protein